MLPKRAIAHMAFAIDVKIDMFLDIGAAEYMLYTAAPPF